MDDVLSSNIHRGKQTRRTQYCGSDQEMIKIENAKLWLMGGRGDNGFGDIRTGGNFSTRMIKQPFSPALLIKCVVEKTEWPLTSDSPIIRVGKNSFIFVMPGMLYGLQLSSNCDVDSIETLEKIFIRFGYYKDYSKIKNGRTIFGSENDPYFWRNSHRDINNIIDPLLKQLGTYSIRDEVHFDMNDRERRARYMSFVVKLISRCLLDRKIEPTEHVVVTGKSFVADDEEEEEDVIGSLASPTILLFINLIEALEESKFLINMQCHPITAYQPRWTPNPNTTFWNINSDGFHMILELIKDGLRTNPEVFRKITLGLVCDNSLGAVEEKGD